LVAVEGDAGAGQRGHRVALGVAVRYRDAEALALPSLRGARAAGDTERLGLDDAAGVRAQRHREQRVERLAQVALRERVAVADQPGAAAVHVRKDLEALLARGALRHDRDVGVLRRPGVGVAPYLEHAVVRHAHLVEEVVREVRVLRRHAYRARL